MKFRTPGWDPKSYEPCFFFCFFFFLLTLYFSGTIPSHIPIVSATIFMSERENVRLIRSFPFLYGPAIDTMHTGTYKRVRSFSTRKIKAIRIPT